MSADPDRVLRRADAEGVDAGPALLSNAILLAANNGYDAGQITGFILNDFLDPKGVDTDEGLLRLRGSFVFGGVIPGVEPNGRPPKDVFQVSEPDPPPYEDVDDEADIGTVAAGTYRGRFTGTQLETLIAASYPGETKPIANHVEITVSRVGAMRFAFVLTLRDAWVTDDNTVNCESIFDVFATVRPRPTANLSGDSPTFESKPFTTSTRQRTSRAPSVRSSRTTGPTTRPRTRRGRPLRGS